MAPDSCCCGLWNRRKDANRHPTAGVRTFSFEELAIATDYFSINNRIGTGTFGEVFKGKLENETVAIKKLRSQNKKEEEEFARSQFKKEAEILSGIDPHKNIVKVLGYCSHDANRLLVYEFLPNNSLLSHLHGNEKPTLNWSNRWNIALGIAEGLAHLHDQCKPKVSHRDIKSANILLDDKFVPKIADFGIAKEFLISDSHTYSEPRASYFYEPPEYYKVGPERRKLTAKSDVFSFGVVLLELITGKFAHLGNNVYLVNWVVPRLKQVLDTDILDLDSENYNNLVDSKLQKNYDITQMNRMICCAAACVYKPPESRPKISEVVEVLKEDKEPKNIWLENDTQYLHMLNYPRRP
ncbi:proline-rich receptor-like protein kinase PERK3 isoform X2 [Hevea brasiliensis]|uniref:proline-rich receptor-like protein kinase PERK3 isoform X2 n=1 Tax=Hevea brasiliensis TaxID=3981 RepID=UPI0025DAC4F2|nr:proline-rich receptor-like protein kinase PERK3 isoform X2 [Hevea brasiliensis]